jgi:L-aspartate oxidase
LEGVVFGARAARAMLALREAKPSGRSPREEVFPAMTETHLRSLTWDHCGITRDGHGLSKAADVLRTVPMEPLEKPARRDYELRSMRRVALLIAMAALEREESRGGHYRSDFPEKSGRAEHSTLVIG